MVLTGDGRALIAADYRHGLIRIPLAGTDTITRITLAPPEIRRSPLKP